MIACCRRMRRDRYPGKFDVHDECEKDERDHLGYNGVFVGTHMNSLGHANDTNNN